MSSPTLFTASALGSLILPNRLIVAPLTRVSATETGEVGPLMADYYTAFGKGGFGAIISEGVYTDTAFSQGYRNQPGIATLAQVESWKPLVKAVKATGAKFIMQLMHAGALSQHNRFNSTNRAPSAIQPKGMQMRLYYGEGEYPTPEQISAAELEEVIAGFVLSAKRAQEIGFDGVEIHSANGYILDQFLTDYANERRDAYGGNTANRIRLTSEITQRVRDAVGGDFTVGVRISQSKVNDGGHRWAGNEDDAKIIFGALAKASASYIHTTEFEADAPAFGDGETLAALASKYSGLPVIANGSLQDPARAEALVVRGDAAFISQGKAAIAAANWPELARAGLAVPEFDFGLLTPIANLATAKAFKEAALAKS